MLTKNIPAQIRLAALVLLYVAFTGMVLTIWQYASFSTTAGFLAFKQEVISNAFWRIAFYIHVFTCFLCLAAGFTQFLPARQFRMQWHRWLGRIYAANIILINFPVALVMGIYANGHLPGKIAFILLDLLWVYFTIGGIYWIRKGSVTLHRDFMTRSYALTLTALTLRLCKFVMSRYTNWSYDDIYIFDAWAALIINLAVAEIIVRRRYYLSNRRLETIR
ncbi:DUF2306 domain-containing protein [Flavihumibacter petaseus]|uniref:DUF2306 domain-containing protein n=1 Tax=Flavihumibacter petaseus NBRC 106054 TaxID=1220578 RepID=A0A0E9N2M3_9BACT|nr:DUF2306 domain-containing protein [Flavihumibacter petaseus]GAO43580.1 hypothetical protein FPE01S_02_06860 [Flavihumibacter petaseus NBRC 106054]